MPRDANGNYTPPAGNPVTTNTLIESTWANNLVQDISVELTDSLSRSGKGGVTGPFQVVDESGGVPGLAYSNEPTSGLRRNDTGDVRMQILGNDRMRWRSGVAQIPEVQVDAVWKPIVLEEAGQKIMRGAGGTTVIFSYNDTAAPGWTIIEPDANIRELIIGPAAGGATIGGTDDPTSISKVVTINFPAATQDHTLTLAQIPPHTHTQRGNGGGSAQPGVGASIELPGDSPSGTAGSGQPHGHDLGGSDTDTVTITPNYARGILMQLDA